RLESIAAVGASYTYFDRDGNAVFTIGPFDLALPAGKIHFIVGGNGSGKSTLFKALTGLYAANAGELRVDGVVVGRRNLAAYRELISVIFSDFHLFTKLYGLLDVDEAEGRRLLELMQLTDKTRLVDGAFSNRRLSTGQRKRLAMVVALLEDRPVYAFDEWAADQDPEFRQYFYDELIPALTARGKIVIAISHDDRYFRCADQILTLDYGRVRSLERMRERPSPEDSIRA
ncbi:MAG: ATP-binding cassette domain-containing protein, partial [Myxococcales bacterium]|nr:ATP-binding cassette domain-containing protein [Myxococcales bacterium]